MAFPIKKPGLPAIAEIKVPSMPALAGGGGAMAGHTFSPGHDAGMGGGIADAAKGLNQSRDGRFGFGAKKVGVKGF